MRPVIGRGDDPFEDRLFPRWRERGLLEGETTTTRRHPQGLIITTLIGVAGALLGGFVATKVFNVDGTQGFFNLSTWITAIAGAAVLLLAYHLISGQNHDRRSGRRSGRWAGPR